MKFFLLELANSLVGSILMGIFPFIWGIKRKKFILAISGFLACLICDYSWGFPLNIFVTTVFFLFILS